MEGTHYYIISESIRQPSERERSQSMFVRLVAHNSSASLSASDHPFPPQLWTSTLSVHQYNKTLTTTLSLALPLFL